jgi:hypothetical protein
MINVIYFLLILLPLYLIDSSQSELSRSRDTVTQQDRRRSFILRRLFILAGLVTMGLGCRTKKRRSRGEDTSPLRPPPHRANRVGQGAAVHAPPSLPLPAVGGRRCRLTRTLHAAEVKSRVRRTRPSPPAELRGAGRRGENPPAAAARARGAERRRAEHGGLQLQESVQRARKKWVGQGCEQGTQLTGLKSKDQGAAEVAM